MTFLNEAIKYLLSFEAFVLLPIIIFVLAIVFGVKLKVAIKSSLQLGIGFVGIFMTFDYFVGIITPVVSALIERSGLEMSVLDVGWPFLAAITWSFKFAPLLLVLFIIVNGAMLVLKLTKTVNIDIWNYWHLIFIGAIIYYITDNIYYTIAIPILSFILLLKLTEWVALKVNKAMKMDGICIPHLSGIVHFPIAVIGNSIIDKIPGLNRIKSDPETLQAKLGLLGEPMIMGLILGLLLGISAGYGFRDILAVGVQFAAVILILPMMGGILGKSLIPISEGMKTFMEKNLPNMGQTYIGLDVAVLFGLPENIVTALLLIPTSIFLAIILPGVNFIPLGDLTNLLVPVAFITLATRGNIFRSYIIGIPIVVLTLYSASWMAPMLTDMAAVANFQVADTSGLFTSFLDGGNIFRTWITMMFTGIKFGFILIPIVILLIYVTWKKRLED